jgi:hypothetical protein
MRGFDKTGRMCKDSRERGLTAKALQISRSLRFYAAVAKTQKHETPKSKNAKTQTRNSKNTKAQKHKNVKKPGRMDCRVISVFG